jgi:hypothetical protein
MKSDKDCLKNIESLLVTEDDTILVLKEKCDCKYCYEGVDRIYCTSKRIEDKYLDKSWLDVLYEKLGGTDD